MSFTYTNAQLYFPPNSSNSWDTISPNSLGWAQSKVDSLYAFLDSNNTKAFILLKDGKIVLEEYFNGQDSTSNWYWASAGKSLTGFLIGIAQQENYLNISDTTSSYLGQGWTSLNPIQEEKITIRHQLNMTSGLDDGVTNTDCIIDTCLQYLAEAGTRWAYHNAPYTLLDQVIENATGYTLNQYNNQKIKTITGIGGLFVPVGDNNVFFSTARSMARFGLLVLNHGNWDGTQIMIDSVYFDEMINTSQSFNESYGYLWWLNGKSSHMYPGTQFVFNGSIIPNAPNDMIAALGKNGQFINIVPSENIVLIRMGDNPDNSLVPINFNDDIWTYINNLEHNPSSIANQKSETSILTYPNPAQGVIHICIKRNKSTATNFILYNSLGIIIQKGLIIDNKYDLIIDDLPIGLYYLIIKNDHLNEIKKIIKN